ncbi:Smg-6, nonsense mediated mRNA decay factor, partial [Podila verticillata]
MSTAKTGLTVPFIPDPSSSKPSRSSRRHNKNNNSGSNNHTNTKHQLERSLSSHNGLNNINNTSNNSNLAAAAASPSTSSSSVSSVSTPTTNNAPTNTHGNNRNNSNRNNNRRRDNVRRDVESVDSVLVANDASPSRGYLSSKTRLDELPRRDPNPRPGPTGRLYDPKRDPVPVVSSPSTPTSRPGEARNPNGHNQKQQQQQRLYDPNQAQSNRQERQSSGAAVSVSATSRVSSTTSSSSSNAAPPDGLVRLTKEIQALEKKVMEKPLRRTLDSDDDGDYTRRGGNTGWSKRIDDSKRLTSKYLKLMQLDFKSSLKHDIDTRCWKMAIYPLIEAFRAALRDSEGGNYSFSESDDDERETIRHYFTQFIATAQEFYVTLMTSLQALEAKHAPASGTPRPPRWHRCVGIMGDLARYRWLHKLDDETDDLQPPTDWLVAARRFYREAIDLGPGNGKMYNQLALLAGCRGLESLYYYCKSLTVKSSFMNARDTLRSFFGANEQIRALQALSLRQNAKARNAALAYTTLQDCEASFLLLQAMLFEKVNLDVFEKRLRMFLKQIKSLHQRQPQDIQSEDWDGLYFMMAVINLAGVYEFNWSSSIIAKSASALGDMPDDLLAVTTLPYSAKLLLATMEQSMLRYLSSIGDGQKVHCSTAEEQQGWLIYCHVVLAWMAGKPFGTSGDMLSNWLFLANHETMPTFWMTLTTFMNHHWDQLTPFEQSDMLSALSDEMSDQHQEQEATTHSLFQLSTPPLGHEWELRGLAWMPTSRYGSKMFKGTPPVLDESELKGDSLWKQEGPKREHLSKRLVELSLIAAL